MSQKNATPTNAQLASIKAAGLKPIYWSVLKGLPRGLIIRHRWTGDVKYINKVKENL